MALPPIDLGYDYLSKNQYAESYEAFKQALNAEPCSPRVLEGLQKIAIEWSKEKSTQSQALEIFQHLYDCDPNNADTLFYYGRLLVWTDQKELAEKILKECIKLAPQYTDAALMLANLYVMENRLDEAEKIFSNYPDHVEAQEGMARIATRRQPPTEPATNPQVDQPCAPKELESLQKIALELSKEKSTQLQALEIYHNLYHCDPLNPDILFYYGRILVWTDHRDQAEEILKECLRLAPQYTDAALVLANLYVTEKRYDEAEEIFSNYTDRVEVQEALGIIAMRRGCYAEAEEWYRLVICRQPCNFEARHQYTVALVAQLKYTDAVEQYEILTEYDPQNANYWVQSMDSKSHTNFAMFYESFYVDAKEDDPTLKVPVVKDYYYYSALNFWFPVNDRWRIDAKQIYYHQRENDIFPPTGVNYTAFISGAQITSHYFFAKDWKWDISARGLRAWGSHHTAYPFQNTTRFEPGTLLTYNGEQHIFTLDAHVESFITKNFDTIHSQLLRMDIYGIGYGYRPDFCLHPQLDFLVAGTYFHDRVHNFKNDELFWFRCGIPFCPDNLTLIYGFEHGGFKHLTTNYFSYKNQYNNILGVKVRRDFFNKKAYLEFYYHHLWQNTYKLFLPVGDFVFIGPKLILNGNRYTASGGYRLKDRMKLELEGHYYETNLPYRDWGMRGSFLWQF